MYIFVAEAVIKIIGLGPNDYFKNNWNKFDFILVVISLCVDVTVSIMKVAGGLKSAKTLRLVRITKGQ